MSAVARQLEPAQPTEQKWTGFVICQQDGGPAKCWCKGRRYTCPSCKRFVPLCFGGAPDPRCDKCCNCDPNGPAR